MVEPSTAMSRYIATLDRYADFLKMSNDDIVAYMEKELPISVDKPYFIPALYEPPTSPKFLEMKRWNTIRILLNICVCTLLFDLGVLVWNILNPRLSLLPTLITTVSVVVATALGIFLMDKYKGKSILFVDKAYKERIKFTEATLNKMFGKRALQFIQSRYDTETNPYEWDNFYANFKWKEVEKGHVIVVHKVTYLEPPLKKV